jgi:hypothetical protein
MDPPFSPRPTRGDYLNCALILFFCILDSYQTYEKKVRHSTTAFLPCALAPIHTKMYINCLSLSNRSVVVCLSILRCASKGKYRDSRLLRSRRPPAAHLLSFDWGPSDSLGHPYFGSPAPRASSPCSIPGRRTYLSPS